MRTIGPVALALAFMTSVTASPGTFAVDDSTSYRSKSTPSLTQNPFLWWKHSWFPGYSWSGYRMRPYFGVSALYPESFLRGMTPIRYNRVEGLTLGFGVPRTSRLELSKFYLFGQLSYAFSMNKVRYRVGLERPLGNWHDADYRILVGGSFHSNTATNDLWKISDPENSLAALFFKEDHLDYFDTYGWTAWLVGEIGAYTQVSIAYRDDRYSTLNTNTNWSVFGGTGFRANPAIDDGRMHSAIVRFEAGRVGGLYSIPEGFALQADAEIGDGLGGDFSFTRYTADARWYWSPDYWYGLAVRFRGGFASENAPIQKTFTVGGLGTVRAWPQNMVRGTRLAVTNAELSFDDVNLLVSRLQLFVFGDVGWTGYSDSQFLSKAETLGAVGFGVGLDQRRLRIEFAIPVGGDINADPWVWLRLYPTF